MYHNVVYISPKYEPSDYLVLDLNTESNEQEWNKAIEIYKDRMENRFLLIIQDMLGNLRDNIRVIDYSFSIMALNCLLVETLRQFYLGNDVTIGNNEREFKKFFRNSDIFRNKFTSKQASIFYKHVRCGILHQAQTQSYTQLTVGQDEMVININDSCIRLDVEKFTDSLIFEYESYLLKLTDKSNVEYRENFIKKMEYICR